MSHYCYEVTDFIYCNIVTFQGWDWEKDLQDEEQTRSRPGSRPPDPLRSYFPDEKQAGIDYNGIRQRTLKKKRFDREYSQAAYLFQIESYKQ